jgi:hypothetical protein
MMIGHSLLAFALVAGAATLAGWSRERTLAVGAVAAAFGAVPDVDMVYALSGPIAADVNGVVDATDTFWSASTLVHRSATHSLIVAVPATLGFGLWSRRRSAVTTRAAASVLLTGLVAVTYLASGGLDAAVMAAFALAGSGIGAAAGRWTDLPWTVVAGAAAVGLVTHPFGDLFTGQPPHLLYPLSATLLSDRVALSVDPTVNLVVAFGLELAVAWLAVVVFLHVNGGSLRQYLHPVAGVGAAYGVLAPVIVPPTLDISYHFVFSVLAVGLGVALSVPAVDRTRAAVMGDGGLTPSGPGDGGMVRPRLPTPGTVLSALVTGTAAVSLAITSYVVVYLLT